MCKLDRVPILFEWTQTSSASLSHSSLIGNCGILLFRAFSFLYTLAVLGLSWWIYPNNKLEWLAWLTNWGQLASVGYFGFAFFYTAFGRKEPKMLSECTAVERGGYMLFELAFSWNVLIALMYWFTVYPTQNGVAHIEMIVKLNEHVGSIVILVLECLFCSISFVPVHLMVVVGLLYVYAAINAAYTSMSYELFSILKWQTFGSVGVLMAITIIVIATFYLGFALHVTRGVIISYFKLKPTPQPNLQTGDEVHQSLLYGKMA